MKSYFVGAYHFTKDQIEEALNVCQGSASESAKYLNISLATMYKLMKKHEIPGLSPEELSRRASERAKKYVAKINLTKDQVEKALAANKGRVSEAAKYLNVGEVTFRKFMKMYEIPGMSVEERSRIASEIYNNRLNRMSEQEKADFVRAAAERTKKWYASLSDEEKAEHARVAAEYTKKNLASMSEEEKEERYKAILERNRKRWASMSEEEKEKFSREQAARAKQQWASLSPEDYNELITKLKESKRKLSSEETEELWYEMMLKRGYTLEQIDDMSDDMSRKQGYTSDEINAKRYERLAKRRGKGTVGARAKWNDASIKAEELVKLAKKNPKTYTNPNLPWEVLIAGADKYPWFVERNPVLGLLELEDPGKFNDLRNAINVGWRKSGMKSLSNKHKALYAADCAERVLPLFQKASKAPYPKQAIESVRNIANYGNPYGSERINPHQLSQFIMNAANSASQAANQMRRNQASKEASVFDAAANAAYAANAAIMFDGTDEDHNRGAHYAAYYATQAVIHDVAALVAETNWQANRVRYYYGLEHPEYQPPEVVGAKSYKFTKEEIEQALAQSARSPSGAAKILGCDLGTVIYQAKKYGLQTLKRSDPEYKQQQAAKIKEKWTDPEYRQRHTEIAHDLWATEEYRNKMEAIASSPDRRKSHSNTMQEKWMEPQFRERQIESMKSPERRQLLSENAKLMWSDDDFRERMSALSKERWSDPEFIRFISDKQKSRWLMMSDEEKAKYRRKRYTREEIDQMYAELMASKKQEPIGALLLPSQSKAQHERNLRVSTLVRRR